MYNYGMMPGYGGSMWGGVALLALWTIFWKGLALWHSARRGEQWWFLALLVINTVGILEIVYLFGFAKIKKEELIPMPKGSASKAPSSAPTTPPTPPAPPAAPHA